MPLYKHIREDVEKLSYIDKTEFKNAKFYMHYSDGDNKKVKVLPFRASKDQLLRALEFIRQDSDYLIKEAERYASGQYNIKNKDVVVTSSD